MTAFHILDDVPSGTTVLEASAGTGKTYAIVSLATRFLALGELTIDELLLVTFSRAATAELRERTRERLTAAVIALGDPAVARASTDELHRFLASDDVAERRANLRRALARFDAATIVTTHAFCQRMLDAAGLLGGSDREARFTETIADLVTEVVQDEYLRLFGRVTDPPMTLREAREIGGAAVADRHAVLAPAPGDDLAGGGTAGARAAFAHMVRRTVARHKRDAQVRDFDDLLSELHAALTDERHGDAVCRRIRERFALVLVDEFQDTDPLQWDILRLAFAGHVRLVVVGDPKQAIYAFRGAEVLSYLEAVTLADEHRELTVNRRSDARLISALDHLYGGAALGHKDIVVHPVTAAQKTARLSGAAALRVRYLPRTGAGPLNKSGFPAVPRLRERVAADVAAQIVATLTSDERLTIGGESRVSPGDIAVLVRTRAHITLIRQALEDAGVPSVLAGGTSVFATDAARDWLWLLTALEQPQRPAAVRLAMLTDLWGSTATELDTGGDDALARAATELRGYVATFSHSGFAAMFERLTMRRDLPARLLTQRGGERLLTDLRHIASVLHAQAIADGLGLAGLVRWLTDRINDPTSASMADRSRRLDSDAAAVQIATIHASKGLEFPIVYVPFAWDAARNPRPEILALHREDGTRLLDVGGESGADYVEHRRTHHIEGAAEELRLLYVALTRAQCQVLCWWAPGFTTAGAPLHRLLWGRDGAGEPAPTVTVPQDAMIADRFAAWSEAHDDVTCEAVGSRPITVPSWQSRDREPKPVAAAVFTRTLDTQWRRTSYSALTAHAHDTATVSSEAAPILADEPQDAVLADIAVPDGGVASPMNGLPSGALFGTAVHAIFEEHDPTAPDAGPTLARLCERVPADLGLTLDAAVLTRAMDLVLRTPLGYGTLADYGPRDRLREMDFELALDAKANALPRIAELLRAHVPADDPLARYPDQLDALGDTELRGYLTGSIDVVLRTPDGRYLVVDYKTNKLARGDVTTAHYGTDAMATEMSRAHYPLQALLYSVALHRFLRWKLPDYEPTRHLGPAKYLFVRAMVGPELPSSGVFTWPLPAHLVVKVSDVLAGH